jgi:hypothetical protein
MAERNSFVSEIKSVGEAGRSPRERLLAADPQGVSVEFTEGARARLDPVNPRSPEFAELLEDLRSRGAFVYIETDAQGNIQDIAIPAVFLVGSIEATREGDLVVELVISHARHVLRTSHPRFRAFRDVLESARVARTPVMVTENLAGEIVDVRTAPPTHPFVLSRPEQAQPAGAVPFTAPGTVNPKRAKELFSLCSRTSCNPSTVPPPCIPFMFPRDGCWARAHEMYRLLKTAGADPWKVWIYGNLVAKTRNDPRCEVRWGWHVAPTLVVETGIATEVWVVDPSLFDEPVPQARWKNVQGDPHATLAPSEGTVFYRYADGRTELDPDYAKTNQVLDLYRMNLKNMSAANGPPPYAFCVIA